MADAVESNQQRESVEDTFDRSSGMSCDQLTMDDLSLVRTSTEQNNSTLAKAGLPSNNDLLMQLMGNSGSGNKADKQLPTEGVMPPPPVAEGTRAAVGDVPTAKSGQDRPDVSKLLETKNVTEPFKKEVEKTVADMPKEVRQLLEQNGFKIVAANTVREALGNQADTRPRGWKATDTWDNSDGFGPTKERKSIVVAEQRKYENKWVRNDRAPGVLRHETGHALDMIFGKDGDLFSESNEFKAAFERDTKNINAKDREALRYQLQTGKAGQHETAADMFAMIMGGPANERDRAALERSFPEVKKLLASKLQSAGRK
jgi:hypothetical protein